jgi:hypothetical protein
MGIDVLNETKEARKKNTPTRLLVAGKFFVAAGCCCCSAPCLIKKIIHKHSIMAAQPRNEERQGGK